MARTRNLQVIISGDAKQLTRAFKQIDTSSSQTEGRLKRVGVIGAKAFGALGVAAAGAAVIGLKKATDAAIEAEVSQAKLTAQLRASGISYQAHAKQIDAVIQKHSRLAGIDDEDLQDAFTNIVRSTGSVSKSLSLVGLAADIARAKHIDVAKAGQLVGKVATGNVTALARYGIQIDKNATSSQALAELQKRFAGQADAYGKTTAGAMDRANVAVENLGEVVGAKVAPLIAKGADALTSLVDRSGELAGPIRTASGAVKQAYDTITQAVSRFAERHRQDIADVIRAARRLGEAIKVVFDSVLVPVVRRAVQIIGRVIGRIATDLGNLIRVVSALINGDWAKAWGAFKTLVSDHVKGVAATIKDVGAAIWDAVTALGKLIVRGIVKGMGNLGHAILDKIKDAAKWVGGQVGGVFGAVGKAIGLGSGDGIGKAIGTAVSGGIGAGPIPGGGISAGGLMGANPALGGVAAVGARFGLRVSSGLRPGAITSSGNPSFHGTGEAVDLADGTAGPSAPKMAAFRFLKSNFGARLAELIYTPGGIGVRQGRPFRYTGQVAADHFDHVHVALDLGRPGPGIGDGLGRRFRAAFTGDGQGRYGAQQLANLWVRAGGKRAIAGLMARVALAESGGNPQARNPSGASGLWQILGQPFKGNVFDPLTNARMAVWKYEHQGLGAWAASRASWGRYVNQPGVSASRGVSTARRGASAGTGATTERVNPYEQAIASADLAIAEAESGGPAMGHAFGATWVDKTAAQRQAAAISAKRKIVGARIRKVRAALAGKLRPSTRLRLTQELAQLKSQHNQLAADRATALTPASAADTGTADATTPQTAYEALQDRIGDIDLRERAGLLTAEQAAAQRKGLREGALNQGAFGFVGEREGLQILADLRDAQQEANQRAEDERRSRDEHTAALKALTDEMAQTRALAQGVTASSSAQAWKALADIMSGQIGGLGLRRGRTPGTGTEFAF